MQICWIVKGGKEMAEKRMFSKNIICSDKFTDMPLTSQALYFHLAMQADDEGFINNVKQIKKMIGASDDDLKILFSKGFIIPFESGVIVITHWHIHNTIRKDRFKSTSFIEEKRNLFLTENKMYYNKSCDDSDCLPDGQPDDNQMTTKWQPNGNQMTTKWQPSGNPDKYSIDKVSIDKVSIDKYSVGDSEDECKFRLGNEVITSKVYYTLVKDFGENIVDDTIKRIIGHPYKNCLNEKIIRKWCDELKKKNSVIAKTQNTFCDYESRNYTQEDFDEIERKLITNVK